MWLKAGFLFVILLVGSYAFPVEKNDMSAFFNYSDASARIVGGVVADRVPYMVALSAGIMIRGFMCGGSLITKRYILTAAHCLVPFIRDDDLVPSYRAVVGTNRWNTGGTMYKLARHIIHAEYNPETIKNDIAFLFTSTDVVMSDTVAVTAINYDFIKGGMATTINGWGKIETDGETPEILLQLNSTVLDGSHCVTEMAKQKEMLDTPYTPDVDPRIEICTFNSPGIGMCHGDSGSPLMRSDLNEQIALVSWSIPCARGAPDVYARLSAYRSWIEQNMQ